MSNSEKIVVRTVSKPTRYGAGDISEWFCEVFDLAEKGDEKEPEIFREVVEKSIRGEGVTSKDLNKKLAVPRSTVIYHLNRLIYTGLIVRRGRRYYLRSEDMESTIEEIRSDMFREFEKMIDFAERLDRIVIGEMHARRRKR